MADSGDPLALFRLDGKVALVTGASSGLGERAARVLHAVGASVVVAARRRERLDALAADLGDRCLPVEADVTRAADREAAVAAAVDRLGGLDVLINNAGISWNGPAEDEPIDEWRRVLDVNLDAPFALSQAAARHMLAAGHGSIVNIASIMGLVGVGRTPQASYNASKGGLVNLTRELSAQWSRRGVRVNCLCPGFFRTEMNDELLDTDEGMRFIRMRTPIGRAGVEGELDGALLLLASEAGSYITGAAIAVDGGWTSI